MAIALAAISCLAGCGTDSGANATVVDQKPSGRAAPPPVTEPVDTLAGYTQECGVELGPVPGFDCATGQLVPVTADGIAADAPEKCDRPSLVRGCKMPTRVGRLNGQNWDAGEDADVSWVFMCVTRDSNTQVVLIGQHRHTGATCFFESNTDNARTEAPPPLPDPNEQEVARDDFWMTPGRIAEDPCHACHTSDPWVHTPFIDQLRDPDAPELPLVPSGADRTRPYYAVASPFEDWPRQIAIDDNACLGCHRIGTGSRFAADLIRQFTNRSRFFASAWAQEWPQSHWMPPTGAASAAEWEATYGADVTAILECMEAPSREHCTAPIPSSRTVDE